MPDEETNPDRESQSDESSESDEDLCDPNASDEP